MCLKYKHIAFPTASLVIAAISLLLPAQTPPAGLPEKYRVWLEEEVVYIITPTERQVFSDLMSERERGFFIEAFWRHRDPSPGTDKNEFREEHYRRLAYANKRFIGAGKPGWKTDRGKVYIILGEPRTQRSFEGLSSVYPAQIWSYQGIAVPSLPQEFDLLFFQKNGMGDFVLYYPAGDGPWSLLPTYRGDPNDYIGAYEMLSVIEPQLARTSISLVPNESVRSFPSLISTAILQNLDSAAYRTVEDNWARKLKDYKSLVEVEYSANYMESGSLLQIIQDASGVPFVHFAIQPKAISVAGEEGGVATDLVFNGILTDLQGRTVYQFEKKVPLRFSQEQYAKLRLRPFCFADLFPILPGEYKLSVLMKNSVSKEFTTLEASVRFPSAFPAPRLSPLLLGFNATRLPAPPSGPKPFVVRDVQIYGDPEATFIAKDTLHIFAQVLGLLPALKAKGSLKFAVEKDGAEVASKVLPLAGNPDSLNFLDVFPLAKVTPGYYRAVVLLLDESMRVLDQQARDFQVSPVDYVPRPWLQAQSLIEGGGPARIDGILGRQRLNLGDPQAALPWLERAHAADLQSRDYAFDLGRALFALNRMAEVRAVLQPLKERAKEDLDLALLLGRTNQALGRYEEAVGIYRDALSGFGQQVQVLNELGECFARLGQKAEAIAAWKKSLEADPGQTAVKEKIAGLDKRLPSPPLKSR
ncbi:MAG: GWxTD domain-containing protein [Candidatus Aminicenantes bacterium]|nr:GWxTD domain-containing protein [Candidatus Aminicenantes bacterium]